MPTQLTRTKGKCKLNPRYDFCDWAGMSQSMLGLQLCFVWVCLYRIWGVPPSGRHCYSEWREEWNSSRQPGGPRTDSRTSNPRQSRRLLCAADHPQLLTGRCSSRGLKLGWRPQTSSNHLWSPTLSFLPFENLPSIFTYMIWMTWGMKWGWYVKSKA